MNQVQLMRIYLGQGEYYFSESKEEVLKIATMPRLHAANAAEKLLRDAALKMAQADASLPARPTLWMLKQPLFRALVERAAFFAEEKS